MKKTITKTDSQKLVRSTKSYLECKVCLLDLFEAWQCTNGHLVCKACKYKCKKCPYCREPINSRNRVLEHLLENYNTRCPNEGCTYNCKYTNMKDHMNLCEHSPCICPFCTDKFEISSRPEHLINHLISCHKAVVTSYTRDKSAGVRVVFSYMFGIREYESNKPFHWTKRILQTDDISFLVCVNCDATNMYIRVCKLYKKPLRKIYIAVENETTQTGFRGNIPFFDTSRNILMIPKTFFEHEKESTQYPNNYLFNVKIFVEGKDVE